MQIFGSSVNTALSQSMINNETTVVALSKSSELLSNPYVIIPATTYDVAMINGLSNLMEQGNIHDGDTIGHIWLDGEYGTNGLCGAQYFAQRHHLTLRDTKPKATAPTSDMPGIQEALRQGTNITTDELVAGLNFVREVSVGIPNAGVLGGIRQVKPLFVAPDAQSSVVPHQSGD